MPVYDEETRGIDLSARLRGDRMTAGMQRRHFIMLLGGAAAWPLAARAQQSAMPVIGYFSGRSPEAEAPLRTPFLKALETSGFTVGRNVAIEYRFAEGQDTFTHACGRPRSPTGGDAGRHR
jgi:hypothetical protein